MFNNHAFLVFATSTVTDGNMSYNRGNQKETLANRAGFLAPLDILLEETVSLEQVHGNRVITVDAKDQGSGAVSNTNDIEADGMITNEVNVFLMIKAADCHQIAFFDNKHKVIALIHAGRQGLALGIIGETMRLMKKHYQTSPHDVFVQFGPSIGPCHYFRDIWDEAEAQLENNGILQKNMFNPRICTYEHDEYFSHRRAEDRGEKDLRFMTVFGIRQ